MELESICAEPKSVTNKENRIRPFARFCRLGRPCSAAGRRGGISTRSWLRIDEGYYYDECAPRLPVCLVSSQRLEGSGCRWTRREEATNERSTIVKKRDAMMASCVSLIDEWFSGLSVVFVAGMLENIWFPLTTVTVSNWTQCSSNLCPLRRNRGGPKWDAHSERFILVMGCTRENFDASSGLFLRDW